VVLFAAGAVAVGSFVLGSLADVDVVVADLYVVVVLMASRVLRRQGLFWVTSGCVLLAVVSHLLSPGNIWRWTAVLNLLFTCATIGLTAFIVFRNVSTEPALGQEQELVHFSPVESPRLWAFKNWSVARKLTVAFAAVVAVIFVSGAIVYNRVGVLDVTLNQHLQIDNARDALDMVRAALRDQQAGERDYLATGNERFLKPYYSGGHVFALSFQKAKELTSDNPAQEGRLDELNALAQEWRGISDRKIALMAKPETRGEARALFGSGSIAMDRTVAKVGEIEAAEAILGTKKLATLRQAYASVYRVTILGGIASIVIVMLMDVILRRGVTVPVRDITSAVTALAKGNTSIEVPGAGRNDEIGAMAAAVEIFRHRMIERDRTEDVLRESEELKRRIIESSRDCIKVLDLDGNLLFMSSGGQQLLEIDDLRPYLNTCWIDFWQPDDRPKISEAVAAARSGGIGQFQAFCPSAKGAPRWWDVITTPICNADGQPEKALAVSRDITEHKRAEEALQASEEKWKAIFENNPTMYFMVDAAGTILSVNRFGAEQLGYTANELAGTSILKIFHEADRTIAQRNTMTCIEQLGRAMSWELRKECKDGSVLWVRETAKAMMIKEGPAILIVCEDITDRKWAENLTAQLFEISPDGICMVGRDYRYQRVNPAYERNLGMPAEKIVGRHLADLLGAEIFAHPVQPNLDRCFEGEETGYTEWITYPSGRRYMVVTYSPIRRGSERVEAVLVITRDLTEHMQASEALQAAHAELAHANRVATMGQLTASIAHEVSQPIAAAVTNAHAILRWLGAQPPDLEEVRQAAGRIIDNG
jgi:PAS domain S-box-containing protein